MYSWCITYHHGLTVHGNAPTRTTATVTTKFILQVWFLVATSTPKDGKFSVDSDYTTCRKKYRPTRATTTCGHVAIWSRFSIAWNYRIRAQDNIIECNYFNRTSTTAATETRLVEHTQLKWLLYPYTTPTPCPQVGYPIVTVCIPCW